MLIWLCYLNICKWIIGFAIRLGETKHGLAIKLLSHRDPMAPGWIYEEAEWCYPIVKLNKSKSKFQIRPKSILSEYIIYLYTKNTLIKSLSQVTGERVVWVKAVFTRHKKIMMINSIEKSSNIYKSLRDNSNSDIQ